MSVMLSAMTVSGNGRRGKKSSAPRKESRQFTLAGQPRKNSTASSNPTPGNSPAGRKYKGPSEFRRSASILSKTGTAQPNLLDGYRRFNAELTNRLSKLGVRLPGDTFASGTGAMSQEIMTDRTQGNNFGISWTEQVRNYQAGHEAHNTSLLSLTSSTSSSPKCPRVVAF